MKKQFLLFVGLLLSLSSFAQIQFEKGYFIDNHGKRIECLIKNMDWYDNPKEFIYKISEGGKEELIGVQSVSEFGIGEQIKFIRFSGKIDYSSSDLNSLSNERNPEYLVGTVFLKVLLEGKASLYYYQSGLLKRYFFNTDSEAIEQLVYKKYKLKGEDAQVFTNFAFRQQLSVNLMCSKENSKVEGLVYEERDLLTFFIQYHNCVGVKFTQYQTKKTSDKLINLNLRPGLSFSSLGIINKATSNWNIDFGNKASLRMGAELEVVFPFNKNKWSFIIEPTFRYYTGNSTFFDKSAITANYKSIEVPLGFRYYAFLNNHSKLFVNIIYIFDLPLNANIDYASSQYFYYDSKLGIQHNWGGGIGYNYHNKYSAEFRMISPRKGSHSNYWEYEFYSYSVVFGINVLGFKK